MVNIRANCREKRIKFQKMQKITTEKVMKFLKNYILKSHPFNSEKNYKMIPFES